MSNERFLQVNKEQSRDALESLLKKIIPKRDQMLLTDFDETLCSIYEYDETSKNHVPIISNKIVAEITRLSSPVFIATSRAAFDPAIGRISQLLKNSRTPMICENGAVIYNPYSEDPNRRETLLASSQQIEALRGIKEALSTEVPITLPEDCELLVSKNKRATIELRVQTLKGVGTNAFNDSLVSSVENMVDFDMFNFIDTGSSVSIQPKGISKGSAFQFLLGELCIRRDNYFVVGLSDAENDKEIFENSDLSIAVRRHSNCIADYSFEGGDEISAMVLKQMR